MIKEQSLQSQAISLRRVIRGIFVLAIAGTLAACGGSNDTPASGGTPSAGDGSSGDGTGTSGGGTGDVPTGGGDAGGGGGGGGGSGGEAGGGTGGGGGDDAAAQVRTMKMKLVASGTDTNMISNAGPWQTFKGEPTGISHAANSDLITIPASTDGQTNLTGQHRFEQPLVAGSEYLLSVDSENTNFAAVIFLVDQYGNVQQFTDQSTGATAQWIAARPTNTLRFVAPLNVAAFYIQLQEKFTVAAARAMRVDIDVKFKAPDPTIAANADGDYLPDGFTPDTLIFAEEFNGTALDRTKWCTRLPYGGGPELQAGYEDADCTKFQSQGVADFANEDENQRFRDVNKLGEELHVVSDGTLKIRATQTDLTRQYQNFEAGAIRSKQLFPPLPDKKYYFTARIYMPNVRGSWPAFYLNPSLESDGLGTTPPEIDIAEGAMNGIEDSEVSITQHGQVDGAQTTTGAYDYVYTAPGFNPLYGQWQSPVTLRDRWIQVSAEWDPKGVCIYTEGYLTSCANYSWVTADGAPGNPATIIASLAVGGLWAGRNGIEETAFPIQYEIDYIRVYAKPYPG